MLTRLGREDGSSAVHGSEGRKETGARVVALLHLRSLTLGQTAQLLSFECLQYIC